MAKAKVEKKPQAIELKKDSRSTPSERSRISVVIHTDIHDRYEGMSTTEIIWGSVANGKFVKELLVLPAVKDAVADFFVQRQISLVLKKLLKTPMTRPGETAFTKAEFHEAVSSVVQGDLVRGAVIELALPALLALGMISNAINYSKQVSYGFDRVTVSDIKCDVSMYQVVEEVKKVSIKLEKSERISSSVFAEAVAEAMRPVGLAIYEIVDMGGVVDDLVRGVRAYLDPVMSINEGSGMVPHDWRNNAIVQELATNLVFVRAALSLPANYPMALKTDSWKLDKWAQSVLTAIKSSERYQWMSKAEALKHYSLRRIRNNEGRPVSAVLARWVETAAVAQAVFAVEDVSMKGAFNINATRDRLADAVQSAYGKAKFSLLEGADLLTNNLEDYIQAGWEGAAAVYVVDAAGNTATLSDIAVLMADGLYVSIEDGKIEVASHLEADDTNPEDIETTWEPLWWFSKLTKEASLRVWSGQHLGDRIVTSDPAEVILASEDRDAASPVPTRPQLLSPAAFNTRLLTFDKDLVKNVDARFSFKVSVAGVEVAGSFRAIDFASLRSGNHTSLVMPHYNAEVIKGLETSYKRVTELNEKVSRSAISTWQGDKKADPAMIAFVKARQARELLKMAQQLDPAFRNELHMMLIERALVTGGIKGSDADRFRAKLTQKSFAANADLIALSFFLFIQGIDADFWRELIATKEVATVCMEMGSDR